MNKKELGWNHDFDEGVRLLATTESWLGIQATLSVPYDFASPNKESYFNFYLGINEQAHTNPKAIEAGVSYSEQSKKYPGKGWHAFLNNNGASRNLPINIVAGSRISISLQLTKGYVLLSCPDGGFSLGAATSVKQGAPKMCLAIHEDLKAVSDRKTWFRNVYFTCTGVWDSGNVYKPMEKSGIKFDFTQLDRKKITAHPGGFMLGGSILQP